MIRLANDHLALTLTPDFGARVLTLTDLSSQREWLAPGDCIQGDAYLGDQARGWDECFPTVGPCDHPAWGGPLRDHGALWGIPWQVTTGSDHCLAQVDGTDFTFRRRLTLTGPRVTADYSVTNTSAAPLPYLYSQHVLLATTPQDRIRLDGITDLTAGCQPVTWPQFETRDLSRIDGPDAGFAVKLYGKVQHAAVAEVIGPTGGIRFQWSGETLPAFGLWLDYGGWPPASPVHQIALEPTTAPADDLASAEAIGQARLLAPGDTHHWRIAIQLIPSVSRSS